MDDDEQLHRSLNEYRISRVEMALSALKWILSRRTLSALMQSERMYERNEIIIFHSKYKHKYLLIGLITLEINNPIHFPHSSVLICSKFFFTRNRIEWNEKARKLFVCIETKKNVEVCTT